MKQFNTQHWFLPLLLLCVLIVAGCSSTTTSAETQAQNNPSVEQTLTPSSPTSTQPMANSPQLNGKATVVMTVNKSPITIEIDGTNAPITAGNFVDLVNKGVYDGLAFHRVVRDPQPFVVQGGDPQSKDPKFPSARLGTGGFIDPKTSKERMIPLEIKPKGAEQPIYSKTLESAGIQKAPVLSHSRGAVAMARSQFPDSASSQFYFALADLPFLDGSYAVFGYVTDGMNVVDQIKQGDRIQSAKVTQGLENLKN
ncbi:MULTISPECIES: peptidylprolyl isomerase [Planktothrix]|uniref:Peptidyl-prolyl cis-trans isomerase n=1 Tax=Planktothrix pseudagardhii TaxID=132604 RepID=A0A9W4D6K6_9CYAN|nr:MULTISPECIES: peptidylprolyl isomerase [Planktothrix]MBD2482989.1 peptidylprolyl isomerase [Planktothrix sp. FACHB-1365]CAD5972893.1 putative peptidyl-prolyl cis-trans isomerase sll0227 [Planktothrix pseudagardhii]